MTDRLGLYNGALRILGNGALASLTENREPRRLLDAAWDDGAVRYCLEQGLWNFATRSARLDYDPDYSPPFGYRYAFRKPEDWVRTAALCSDESFNSPVTQYADEVEFWFCDLQTLYVQYVSDDEDYGLNYAAWPETFSTYVEYSLAQITAPRLTGSDAKADKIAKDMQKAKRDALAKDAMNQPARFLPLNSWARARFGNRWDAR